MTYNQFLNKLQLLEIKQIPIARKLLNKKNKPGWITHKKNNSIIHEQKATKSYNKITYIRKTVLFADWRLHIEQEATCSDKWRGIVLVQRSSRWCPSRFTFNISKLADDTKIGSNSADRKENWSTQRNLYTQLQRSNKR